jgi:hypothetical protein
MRSPWDRQTTIHGIRSQRFRNRWTNVSSERELGWNRRTIRKGMKELKSGQPIVDGFKRSGRKRVETKLPNLLKDIKSLVDPHSQADPSLDLLRKSQASANLSSKKVHNCKCQQSN